jgi:hypothetical protein
MPAWIADILISIGSTLISKWAIPFLEKEIPSLAPLLEEIIKVLKGSAPSKALDSAACQYGVCRNKDFEILN